MDGRADYTRYDEGSKRQSHGHPQHDAEEELTQAKRIKVIQRLLREFDLEECMSIYRSLYCAEHRIDPKELSLESEMAGLKVKSHLESLMGTDIVKLNDREYMLSLQSRLMSEYETTMNKEEEQRSEIERRRQRRLYIEGLQDLPNIDSKSAKSKSAALSKSMGRANADRKSTVSHNDSEELYMKPTIGLSANPSRSSRLQTKTRQSAKVEEEKGCAITLAGGKMSPAESREIQEKYPSIDDELNTQRSRLMKQLRKESTVNGLYKTADLVLSAPVAQFVADTHTVSGSPLGSITSRSGTMAHKSQTLLEENVTQSAT